MQNALSPPAAVSFVFNLHLFLSSLQKIMKRLIKRYVLKAQVDKESDEVNEGKNRFFNSAHFSCIIISS